MNWPLEGRADLVRQVVEAIEGDPGCAILQGDLGVGKTRLARAVVEELRERGWHVETCIGSAAAASIPFGALSHLVDPDATADGALGIERLSRALLRRAAGARALLLIDDAGYLDAQSMALAHRHAVTGDASVLATRRTGDEGNDETLASLWKDGYARRFDVPCLDRDAHDRLVAAALGPVKAAGLVARLWQLTRGNPLFLHELLGAADGDLEDWLDKQTPVTPAGPLIEIIGSRTRQLPGPLREALEVIAMAEPVDVDIIGGITGREPLDELQRRSMVALEDIGGLPHATTVHPIYGSTIRAMIPAFQRETIARRLADAFSRGEHRHPGDSLRAAVWLREVGSPVPPDVAVRAANEALSKGDAALAESLAGSAVEAGGGVEALVARGNALSMQQEKAGEAEAVLARALEAAETEDDRVKAALAASRYHAWVGRDFERGVLLLEGTVPRLSVPSARSELRAEEAFFYAAAGDAARTISVTSQVLADPEASPAATLSSLVHSTRARTMLGRFDGLEEELDRAEELGTKLRDVKPLALDQVTHNRAMAARFVDLAEARRISSAGYERSLREGGPGGMWSGTLAWISADAGDLDEALGQIARAGGELERFDPFHQAAIHRAIEALVHALRGELDEAAGSLERSGPLDELEPRSRAWADRAAVWISASSSPAWAAALAVNAGQRAESHQIITWGASLLYHDAVRLGRPDLALEPLARLKSSTSAPIVALMADHARAAAEHDGDRLPAVADEFEARGSKLFAAETLAQASLCAATDPLSAKFATRASVLASACPGARTPLITALKSPLSEREREIAALAAEGASGADIAQKFVLSARTVDNHLGRIYRKLGLAGREELSLVFAPVSGRRERDTALPCEESAEELDELTA